MSDYQKYFRERYSRMLLEQDFDITQQALDGIEDWKNVETSADTLSSLEDVSDDGVETLEVIDKDAWTEDDLQDSYDGKVILECVACHSRITVDQADVYEDEETQTACPDIMCPVCHSELGYTILGKIEKFNAPDEEEEEKIDFPEEEPEVEEEPEEEEEEEEVQESLKTRLQRRRLGESKELDEKLPKNLSRSKDELRGKFGKDIDFENSTFDEISPEELAGMDRAGRKNVVIGNRGRTNLSSIGERGARSGRIIDRDWNNRDVNTGIDVDNPAEVRRYLNIINRGDSKIYNVNPVNKDPEKLAARKPNAYIGKANDARRNAKNTFNADPERYSWNDPEQQRARDLKSAQGYRNAAADYMNQRFDDPDVKAYRQAKDSIKTDKSWKQYADNDVERNQDRVRSAELASQYGSRYANDIVDYERRAKEYQAYADDARKKGLEHAKNMSDEERGYIARDLETANDRLQRSKEASDKYQGDIDKTMADFKARHNKRMGKSESLNEAPEGYDYNNLYTPEQKGDLDVDRILDSIDSYLRRFLNTNGPRIKKLLSSIQAAQKKVKFDVDAIAHDEGGYLYSIAERGHPDSVEFIIQTDPEINTVILFININNESLIYQYDRKYGFDYDSNISGSLEEAEADKDFVDNTNFGSLFNEVMKKAYAALDKVIDDAGYVRDESLKEGKDCEDCEDLEECGDQLTEAVNNLSLDTDDTHLEMTADENGRISVVSEPTNAPMEEVPDTAVQGEDSIVPLDMGDMAEVEDNISPDEQNEIMDAESEEPEVPAAEETEGSEGAEEPLESEEEFEVEAESFSYLGNTFAKKLYENVNSYKMTSSNEVNGKLVVEGVIKFNSGNSKKTRFVFDEAKETRTGRIVLEGINPTFYNGKAFKLKGKLNNGKLFCESLKYNYSIDNLNESTGKTEPIAIRGIVRSK